MKIEKNDILNSILKSIYDMKYIQSDAVPNIDLYMDQVTSFMEENLKGYKRYEDDKILTKTMINNYVKDGILPAPVKKKYSKEHLLLLVLIYYFKNILSIKDVESIIKPITEKYFHAEAGLTVSDIYDTIWSTKPDLSDILQNDLRTDYALASSLFDDAPEEDREMLKHFSFICALTFDVYAKKQIIETMIDELITKEKPQDK